MNRGIFTGIEELVSVMLWNGGDEVCEIVSKKIFVRLFVEKMEQIGRKKMMGKIKEMLLDEAGEE